MTPSQELPGDPTTMVFAVPLAGTTVRRAIRRSTPMVPVRQRSHSLENSPRWIRWSPRTSESEVPNVFFFEKGIWNKQQSFLVGGWTNPVEKYESKWESSPIFGVKIKNLWNHHLVFLYFPNCFWKVGRRITVRIMILQKEGEVMKRKHKTRKTELSLYEHLFLATPNLAL